MKSFNPYVQLCENLERTIDSFANSIQEPTRKAKYDNFTKSSNVYDRLTSPSYFTGTQSVVFRNVTARDRRGQNHQSKVQDLKSSQFAALSQFLRPNETHENLLLSGECHQQPIRRTDNMRQLPPRAKSSCSRSTVQKVAIPHEASKHLQRDQLTSTTTLKSIVERKEPFAGSIFPIMRSTGFQKQIQIKPPKSRNEYQYSKYEEVYHALANQQYDPINTEENQGIFKNIGKDTPPAKKVIIRPKSCVQRAAPWEESIFEKLNNKLAFTGSRFVKFNEEYMREVELMNQETCDNRFFESLRK